MNNVIFDYFILIFTLAVVVSYSMLGFISAYKLIHYKKTNKGVNYNILHSSPYAPGISILAPAYNESKTIIDNINALLSIHYGKFEVIIINDGSSDDTMEKIIREYQLKKVDYVITDRIPTQEVKGVYKSSNKAYHLLSVIDKVNGGKADALNAGVNFSDHNYFVAIDVDSVIEPDALLKLTKPFLQAEGKRVIAVGSAIRIANSCKTQNGQIVEVSVPKNLWACFQVIEYTRAFLMGRIAWSKMNGLLLISGALGMFDKDIVVKCGGYRCDTVGEDMELVVKMRRYAYENKIKHIVEYIPDPLCWTEVPSKLKILGRQRNRWTRGIMDSLRFHRKMLLNPHYGFVGMVSYPYWLFLEWLAILLEFAGIVYFVYLIYYEAVNWVFFAILLAFVYTFSVAFSSFAILFEEFTFHRYKKISDVLKLFLISIIEPFIYHPLTVYWAIRGNISYMTGDKNWGRMERSGFDKKIKSS